jgi:hypothetical protein
MTSEKAEFIRIGPSFVNLDAISYIKTGPGGVIVHLRGSDHTFTVRAPYAAEIEDFLVNHMVLDIQGDPPTGGAMPGTIR